MEENYGNVSEQVVSAQEESNYQTDTTPTISEEVEVANPQVDNVENSVNDVDNQVQSPEENSRYAKIRREAEARAEQRAMDKVVQEMQMEWNGRPISTYADYQRALREQSLMQEAEQQGIDPQFYAEFKTMQEELKGYRQEKTFMEQERELANDPIKGEFYGQWKDEIRQMATTYGVDLRTAFTITLENNLPNILNSKTQQIQNETIKKINQNSNSSVGSLSQQAENPSFNAWDMNKEEFEAMIRKAKG